MTDETQNPDANLGANPEANPAELSFAESSVAGTGHFILVLLLLLSFPVILHYSHIFPTEQTAPAAAGHLSPLLKFSIFVTAYLWFIFLITAIGVGAEGHTQRRGIIVNQTQGRYAFLKTIGVAILTFAAMMGIGIGFAALSQHLGMQSTALQLLSPHTVSEALGLLVTAISAGFIEEFVFRGYLQRQLEAATKNVFLASFLQVLIFTVGHYYQGALRLIPVFLLGCLLTAVAKWRKTLVPGMLAHGTGDALGPITFLLRFLR